MVAQSPTSPDPAPQDWKEAFLELYSRTVERFQQGKRSPEGILTSRDSAQLADFVMNPQEIYDFVEDWVEEGEPDPETVLAITEVRREYFLTEQDGQRSSAAKPLESFPSRTASLEGLTWLPRIIAKAEAKLRGELPPDLMYSCGADRRFLRQIKFHPAEFLRLVWAAQGQTNAIVSAIQKRHPSPRKESEK